MDYVLQYYILNLKECTIHQKILGNKTNAQDRGMESMVLVSELVASTTLKLPKFHKAAIKFEKK